MEKRPKSYSDHLQCTLEFECFLHNTAKYSSVGDLAVDRKSRAPLEKQHPLGNWN